MGPELMDVLVGANRTLLYTGYVLLAGTLTFWTLVWPEGGAHRKLVLLAVGGIILMALTSVSGPILQRLTADLTWPQILTPVVGVALLIRFAALATATFFMADIVSHPVRGVRLVLPVMIVLVLAVSLLLVSNAVDAPWQVAKTIATLGHVIATAAWLGGLLALAAVLIPGQHLSELDLLIPRFSLVAATSVTVLVVTGTIHAVAVAGGLRPLADSPYGLVLVVKASLFAAMLVLGNHGRTYAARVAWRATQSDEQSMRGSHSVHSLAVVMGAELAIAAVVLATTSVLVMVAPAP
ncbi:MAG: CopD family protein [Ornithinimicrobium sp.]